MTREQKIKSIVEAYATVFEEEMKKGTMTTGKSFIVYAQKYEGTSPMDEFIVSQAFEKERS